MQTGGENDHKRLGAGIDPHGGAGITGVPEGTFGKRGVKDPAVGRPDVPAEAALGGNAREALGGGHGCDRLGAENPFALNLAAIDEHLGQEGQVVGRGKDAGITGYPAHAVGGGIGHYAPAQTAPLIVGGGDAGFQGRRRQERRVLHAQGLEDLTFAEDVQRHVGDPVHDLAQGNEIDVAVIKLRPRSPDRLILGNGLHGPVVIRPGGPGSHPGAQTGRVGHELADGNPPLAVGGKGGPIFGRGFVEVDEATIHQHHDRGGGGHDLGERGEVEDGVRLHGQGAGGQGAQAEGLAVHGLAPVAHQDDGPGDVPGGDLLLRPP